ncbi:MAG: porin family protein [Legionella sp.]
MLSRLSLCAIILSLLEHLAFANATMPMVQPTDWNWVTTITAGPVLTKGGQIQTLYLTPTIEKTYTAKRTINAIRSSEFFIGAQQLLTPESLGQLGLAIATTGSTTLEGNIWDDANAQFNNYHYRYKIQNTRITAKGKLLIDKDYWLIPWIEGSLGIGFNRARDFTNTSLLFQAYPNQNFGNHTQVAFTYSIATGVQQTISEHCQIGIGYEFADWGKSALGRAESQILKNRLRLNHLYTNGILFNLTYIA